MIYIGTILQLTGWLFRRGTDNRRQASPSTQLLPERAWRWSPRTTEPPSKHWSLPTASPIRTSSGSDRRSRCKRPQAHGAVRSRGLAISTTGAFLAPGDGSMRATISSPRRGPPVLAPVSRDDPLPAGSDRRPSIPALRGRWHHLHRQPPGHDHRHRWLRYRRITVRDRRRHRERDRKPAPSPLRDASRRRPGRESLPDSAEVTAADRGQVNQPTGLRDVISWR